MHAKYVSVLGCTSKYDFKAIPDAEIANLSTYLGALTVYSYSETFSPRSVVTSPSPGYGALSTGVPEHYHLYLYHFLRILDTARFHSLIENILVPKREKNVHEFSRRRDEMSNFESRRNMC